MLKKHPLSDAAKTPGAEKASFGCWKSSLCSKKTFSMPKKSAAQENTVAVLVAPCVRRWTMSTCSSGDCSNRPGSLRRFTPGYRTSMLRVPSLVPWQRLRASMTPTTCLVPLTKTSVSRCFICELAFQPRLDTTTRKLMVVPEAMHDLAYESQEWCLWELSTWIAVAYLPWEAVPYSGSTSHWDS